MYYKERNDFVRKFTDFIIDKRHFILLIFIVLTIISAFLSKKVTINYDLSRYLPSTSETRIGIDIMDEEFAGTETSSLNVMFKGLEKQEKKEIYDSLSELDGISSVDYDETEEYNKDDYTLYVVNVDDEDESDLAKRVYTEINEKYKDYDMYKSGSIEEKNHEVLSTWVVAIAVFCVLIILIIMCGSYAEPFLFLIAILMAVVLNTGTNIIFNNVSNITNSITAILQMALSMDYSIMLMNRYNQEKEKEKDNKKAMKNALNDAFKSISSSSVTTIVGLLALVFMSFTIGKDLGIVLAKGVMFSLISIFFVLPALILIFDKWIVKTKKKSPNLKLDALGKFAFGFRKIAIFVFIGIFMFSFITKGNLKILYAEPEDGKIAEIFGENNQIAIIYNNREEEKIRNYLDKLEANEKIDSVLAYGSTIDKEMTYQELNEKLKEMSSDVDIEDYLLKILYFNYYNQDEKNTMTFDEFVEFLENEVYDKPDMKDQIDDETMENIDRLKNFTSEAQINKLRSAMELAEILEMEKTDIEDIFVYYNSKHNSLKISINDFIKFMNNDVLTNEKYSKNVDQKTKEDLKTLSKYISVDTIKKKMTAIEMAKLFDMDTNSMNDLYKYYVSIGNIDLKMTIADFTKFVLNDVLNSEYANQFDEETIKNIKLLNTFSNSSTITSQMEISNLSNLFEIEETKIKQLLYIKYSTIDTGDTKSLSEFINQVSYIKENTSYLDEEDLSSIEKLSFFASNENNINVTKLSKEELASMFNGIRTNFVQNIYLLAGLPDDYKMSPQEFIHFVVTTLSYDESTDENGRVDTGAFLVDDITLNQLKLLQAVIDDSVNANKTQHTATRFSKFIKYAKISNVSII